MNEKKLAAAIGKNLRKARLARKMTQNEVGQEVGIAGNHYAAIERGKHIPKVTTLVLLCKALKVKIPDILDL